MKSHCKIYLVFFLISHAVLSSEGWLSGMDASIRPAMPAFFLLDQTVIIIDVSILRISGVYENIMNVFGTITFLHLRRAHTL